MLRWREHERAGVQHVRQRAGIVFRIGRNLGESYVSRRANEFLELPVGNRRPIDEESIDGDAMNRSLFRIVSIRAHAERATRNPDHSIAKPWRGIDRAVLLKRHYDLPR